MWFSGEASGCTWNDCKLFKSVCVLARWVTTQQHTTKDESLRLISPTNCSVFPFSAQSSTTFPSIPPSAPQLASLTAQSRLPARLWAAAPPQRTTVSFSRRRSKTKDVLISYFLSWPRRPLSNYFPFAQFHFQAAQICASPAPKSSLPNGPGWPPLPEIWLELQSWLDGMRGIKNQAITVKKLKSCVLYGSGVPRGGGD